MYGTNKLGLIVTVLSCAAVAFPVYSQGGLTELFEERWADHLPEYCLYTQMLPDNTPGLYNHPLSTGKYGPMFGPAWHHLHHFCFGLEFLSQATYLDEEDLKSSKYHQVIAEFDYVLLRCPDDFILKPEIYLNKGAVLELLHDPVSAVEAYTEAIRLRPDYVPAYVGLSNCFETLGSVEQAVAIIDSALKVAPDSEILLERRADLTSRANLRSPESNK